MKGCKPIDPLQLVGLRLGHTYQVTATGELQLQDPEDVINPFKEALEVTRDNRDLLDDGSNQKLSSADIDALKTQLADGQLTGQDIIGKICESSATFDKKNEFSQQKYLKKKRSKYLMTIKLLLPTLFDNVKSTHLLDSFMCKNLREDSLAAILSLANIHPGMNVLLYDTVNGLLTSSILTRLDGSGELVSLVKQRNESEFCVQLANLTAEQKIIRKNLDISKLVPTELLPAEFFIRKNNHVDATAPVSEPVNSTSLPEQIPSLPIQDPVLSNNTEIILENPSDIVPFKKNVPIEVELTRRFDAAVIVLIEPFGEALLNSLLSYLQYSRQIVFYSPYKAVI